MFKLLINTLLIVGTVKVVLISKIRNVHHFLLLGSTIAGGTKHPRECS
jgi:hypothetical protein